MKIYVLKIYNDLINIDFEKAKNECFVYSKNLSLKGWVNNMMEGCMISPDGSTCFEYNRSPYYGQLKQYERDNEEKFNKIVEELKEDFIEN